MSKVCNRCHILQELTCFSFRMDTKKHHNTCKKCKINISANWCKDNSPLATVRAIKYYRHNAEKIKARSRKWRLDNPERAKALDKKKHDNTPKDIKRKRSAAYRKKYPHKVNARTVNYRNKKKMSAISKLNIEDIYVFYKNCPKGMQVDHIIPISNKLISGLHVPWNLQYLTPTENKKKNNKFDGTYNNDSWRING